MQTIDILAFDAVSKATAGYLLELKGPDNITSTGVKVRVLGKHSDVVQDWTSKVVNQMVRDAEYQKRRGKTAEPQTVEEIRENNRKGAVIRVTGWEGVKQDFSPELLDKVLQRNPHWIDQIIEASDDVKNFS
jgi:L-alanine-DL-glutamate epimerase-like enolase superfamily enzyme